MATSKYQITGLAHAKLAGRLYLIHPEQADWEKLQAPSGADFNVAGMKDLRIVCGDCGCALENTASTGKTGQAVCPECGGAHFSVFRFLNAKNAPPRVWRKKQRAVPQMTFPGHLLAAWRRLPLQRKKQIIICAGIAILVIAATIANRSSGYGDHATAIKLQGRPLPAMAAPSAGQKDGQPAKCIDYEKEALMHTKANDFKKAQEAYGKLAHAYMTGTDGYLTDYGKAAKFYEKIQDRRHAKEAYSKLAKAYMTGTDGYENDFELAAENFKEAGETENEAKAYETLGDHYHQGIGGYPKDAEDAADAYLQALEKGGDVRQKLAALGEEFWNSGLNAMEEYKKYQYSNDLQTAIKAFQNAANLGHSEAKSALLELQNKQ